MFADILNNKFGNPLLKVSCHFLTNITEPTFCCVRKLDELSQSLYRLDSPFVAYLTFVNGSFEKIIQQKVLKIGVLVKRVFDVTQERTAK